MYDVHWQPSAIDDLAAVCADHPRRGPASRPPTRKLPTSYGTNPSAKASTYQKACGVSLSRPLSPGLQLKALKSMSIPSAGLGDGTGMD